jgi:hypothetical protein
MTKQQRWIWWLVSVAISTHAVSIDRVAELPERMLWLWDRPQYALPLPADISKFCVALHVQSYWLSADQVRITPRRNPLELPAEIAVLPVFHFDVDPNQTFVGSAAQRTVIVQAIVKWQQRQPSSMIQIDFEARPSSRAFLQALLVDLRAALPAKTKLSMTALASWCFGDRWIASLSADALPVDEIVPMFFRMGPARAAIMQASLHGIPEARCRSAYGIATDEPQWRGARLGRQYLFIGAQKHRKETYYDY